MYDVSREMKEQVMECKSIAVYKRLKDKYDEFKKANCFVDDTIGIFMDFMHSLSSFYKVSSMWQAASCINKFLRVEKNLDLISCSVFKSYMKKLEKQHVSCKASTLDISSINKYLIDGPKTPQSLQVRTVYDSENTIQ